MAKPSFGLGKGIGALMSEAEKEVGSKVAVTAAASVPVSSTRIVAFCFTSESMVPTDSNIGARAVPLAENIFLMPISCRTRFKSTDV